MGEKWTPGPWRVSQAPPTKTRGIDVLAGYAVAVAHVPVAPAYMTEHPEHANARLIAAAPAMAEALAAFIHYDEADNDEGVQMMLDYDTALTLAHAALALARGEP